MRSPAIAVDSALNIAPYQQIVEQIRGLVQSGDLKPGTTLPTVRQLADDLNVAPNTVARAYAELQNDGWLVSQERRGTRIADRLPKTDREVRGRALHDAVDQFLAGLVGRGYSRSEILNELRKH